MKIWLVIGELQYEPGAVVEVFSTKSLADAAAKRFQEGDQHMSYDVHERILDSESDASHEDRAEPVERE